VEAIVLVSYSGGSTVRELAEGSGAEWWTDSARFHCWSGDASRRIRVALYPAGSIPEACTIIRHEGLRPARLPELLVMLRSVILPAHVEYIFALGQKSHFGFIREAAVVGRADGDLYVTSFRLDRPVPRNSLFAGREVLD
jgi:hypothetical protein